VEKETNVKKRKIGIIIFIIVILIAVSIGVYAVSNVLNDDCENEDPLTPSNIKDITLEAKPIIYIYPEEEQEVSVKVGNSEKLTCTYPKYNDGWNVIAKPNGDLVDISTGRYLYALYWEGIDTNAKIKEEGFVVKGKDSIKFLEEKLEILGLNERESEEFIVYWLPKLEANKYNYIRFETIEEIEEDMLLIINPVPDTMIRIVMNFKGLDKPIKVKEQKLTTPIREGFTIVEWGGTEIK